MAPSQDPQKKASTGRSHRWLGVVLATGSVLLLVGAGAAWRGWVYARENASDWLAAQLSEALERPVTVGPVQRVSLSGLRLGPSTMAATPTDPDHLHLGALEVRVQGVDLRRRDLRLALDLEQVELWLEQDAQGQWVNTDLEILQRQEEREPPIQVSVSRVNLQEGRLTLIPHTPDPQNRPQVVLEDIQGQGEIQRLPMDSSLRASEAGSKPRSGQQIDFQVQGTSIRGGDLHLAGSLQVPSGPTRSQPSAQRGEPTVAKDAEPRPPSRAKLNLRAQAVQATDILPLVESFLPNPLPVQFPTGLVSGQVDMQWAGQGLPSFYGTARVTQGTVLVPRLPEPVQDLQGDVRFKGQQIEFEAVTAQLGDLTARAGGRLDLKTGYALTGQVNPFTVAQVSDLFAVELPVAATGTFGAEVTMTGPLGRPVIKTVVRSKDEVTLDQLTLASLGGEATLTLDKLSLDRIEALFPQGGALTGQGQWTFGTPGQLALSLTGDRLPGDALGSLYGLPATLTLGPVFATVEVAGPVGQLTGQARWQAPQGTYPARGVVSLADNSLRFTDTVVQVGGGTVAGSGTLALGNRQWQATLQAQGIQLNQVGVGVAGVVNGEAQLAGVLDDSGLRGIRGQAVAGVTVGGGLVHTQAELNRGQWTATAQGHGLALAAFSPNLMGTGSGHFQFAGSTDDLSLAGVRGQGQLVLSDGLATVAPLAPQLTAWRQPLTADLAWNGQSVLIQQASTGGIRADGVMTPLLSAGAAPALAHLDLNLSANQVSLAALPLPDLVPIQGVGSFNGRVAGRPNALTVDGEAALTGLAVGNLAFASPLVGPVSFRGAQGLAVDLQGGSDRIFLATGQGDHDVDFLVQGGTAYAQGHTQGDRFFAQIHNLPLDGLKLPQAGLEGFGSISGTVESATVQGNWREPSLVANFNVVNPGLGYIRLRTVEVEPEPVAGASPLAPVQPLALKTRYGRLQGSLSYANRVVGLAGVRVESASGESRYMVSGTYALDTAAVNGKVSVDNGQIQDLLQTFKIFELSDFRLNLLLPPGWYRAITEADLVALTPVKVGDRNASLLDQLRRLAEILALQDQLAAQAEVALLPPLEGLNGSFSGTVTAAGTLPQQVRVDVDLEGENWLWKDPDQPTGVAYRLDDLIAKGSYDNGVIRLKPVRFASAFTPLPGSDRNQAIAEFNGEFSLNPEDTLDRTLRLEVADVPIEAVRKPLRVPDNLDGFINVGATLTGGIDNPQLRGRLAVNDATINRQPIEVAAADFSYRQARLNLLGNVAIPDQTEPVSLVASLPLPLPGVKQKPETDDIGLRLRVQDDGFALINLISDAITWETGQAELNLRLLGQWPANQTFKEALTSLVVSGSAQLDGVTLRSRSFPDPLTNLRGEVRVVDGPGRDDSVYRNGLVLDFQNLQGDFSAGKVMAQGKFKLLPSIQDLAPGAFAAEPAAPQSPAQPLLPNQPDPALQDDRLRLTLDRIALDFRSPSGVYRGQLDGEMVVDGSLFLLEPELSGGIT
ncbi:MAG TPA: hypothetical protein IGR64_02245, partial [Leptolyngbyaceae cyanobacterium M65_K2018_010]|nr:hypothetical protein [Leptolyngbyaceae cyanobacterium M65_K2018_010]